ncbi:MAG: hypothetical protein Q8P49_01645 [Candidatus Liptonbacteria bacterium]|nr:hypothetical protein [Candidatus Liptonbacteria bacterium]
MNKLFLSGLALFLFGLYLAFIYHSTIWYSFFVIGGFIMFEGINRRYSFSVLRNKKVFLIDWFIFVLITVAVELIGNFWLRLWYYPGYSAVSYLINVIVIGYAFTGFFGLEFFTFVRRRIKSKTAKFIILPITALLFGYINEYPNTFAYEWVYENWPLGELFRIPILVSVLWIALLTVLLFGKPFDKRN